MSEPISDDAMSDDVQLVEFDPDNPIVLVPRSEEEKATLERVVLFTLGDKQYSIPKVVRPNVAMGYLYLSRTRGIAAAENWLGESLLGAEAFEALIGFDDLTQDQSNEIFRRAREVVFGKYDPKAQQSGNGSSTARPKRPSSKRKSTRGSSTQKTKSSPMDSGSTE